MPSEFPFEPRSDALPEIPPIQLPLAGLRPRIRRAADSARRSGPEGATLLRRSIAVYADHAWGSDVPEDSFLTAVNQELVDVLTSRISMRRLLQFVDAAAQGALDGYARHDRLVPHHLPGPAGA